MSIFNETDLDVRADGTGLNVKPIDISPPTYERNGDSLTFDRKLDEILTQSFTHVSYKTRVSPLPDTPYGSGGAIDVATELGYTKQFIKQLIASELGAIIDANTDENGTDSDRVYEVLIEWLSELRGGGDE